MQRDLRFRILAGVELFQAVSAALITLLLAVLGAGYWALVLGNIVALTAASAVTMRLSPQRFGAPRLVQLRPAATLSRDLTISTVCWYLYSNADFLVVGKVLGQAALGIYNIGWTLALLIVERVTTIVGGVTPAYLAAAKHDIAELRRYLLLISGSIALLTFPVSAGLALVADDFCGVVLGPKWASAVTSLRLLAMYAGVRSLTPVLPQILVVLGEHRFVARNALAAAIVMPVSFWVGARWGVSGVALAWVLVFPIVTAPPFIRALRMLELPATSYGRNVRVPLGSTVIMASCVLAFRLLAVDMFPPLRFGISVALGALTYVGALYFVFGARPGMLIAMARARTEAT
jgi:PST family polysaccharide transporter